MLLPLLLTLSGSLPQERIIQPSAKVLMIGLDGVRPDALMAAKTPNLDILMQRGKVTLEARTTPITSSGPAWTSILSGARQTLHGVTDNSFENSNKEQWPTWIGRLESARPSAYTVAISHWAPIHIHLTNGKVDLSLHKESQAAVTAAAREALLDENNDVTAMFLHYDDVDGAGHAHGYSVEVPEYIAAIESVDVEVGKVLDTISARKNLLFEDWLIMVGTDHGGLGTNHGSNTPECRTVFEIATSSRMREANWRKGADVIDFAALALNHLELPGTCVPVSRVDYWWWQRQALLNERGATNNASIAFFGDSITEGWEYSGADVWQKAYATRGGVNLGISGDRTQHLLWRIQNGNIEGIRPAVSVVMIGTNNTGSDSSEQIANGVKVVVAELLENLPETQVLLLAIFPRGADQNDPQRQINSGANQLLQSWAADIDRTHFLNINDVFLEDEAGNLPIEIMPDYLHPNAKGYELWAQAMEPELQRLLKISDGQ